MVTQNSNPTDPKDRDETPAAPFVLSEEQRETIASLTAWQERLKKTDALFCRDHLSYKATVWYRIKTGEYWTLVKSPDAACEQLSRDLRRLEREQAIASRYGTGEIFPLDDFRAVLRAVDQARAKSIADPDRLIVFLADTGGGKSVLCGQLAKEAGAKIVQAREGWLSSYFNCLRDFATAVGADTGSNASKGSMETDLLAFLAQKKTIIAVDEAEFFGAKSLNLLKLILNTTPTVIVICAMPEAYARWNRANWHEARQIRRRTHILIHQEAVHPNEASRFLSGGPAKGCLKEAAVLVAGAANQFGRFDTVKRIAVALLDGPAEADLEDVKKAIQRVQTFLGFTPATVRR